MVGALYKLSAIVLPAGQIYQIISRDIDTGIQELLLKGDGKLSPQFVAVMSRRPAVRFTTTAIAAALTTVGSAPYASAVASDFFFTKYVDGGGVGSGATHAKLSAAKILVIPRELTVEQDREATLDFDTYFISADGVTSPISYTGSVSLPTLTVTGQAFTLGPAMINGSTIADLDQMKIQFGYQETIMGGNGEVFATFGGYTGRAPRVTFRSRDVTLLNTILGTGGVTQGGTASKFFLRKMAAGAAARVADATAQHIKLTMTLGMHTIRRINESDDSYDGVECEAIPVDDGTNDIMAVSLASAIA